MTDARATHAPTPAAPAWYANPAARAWRTAPVAGASRFHESLPGSLAQAARHYRAARRARRRGLAAADIDAGPTRWPEPATRGLTERIVRVTVM